MGIRPAAVHPGAATLVRPRFAAPTPVQLGPLAPPGELLYAESVTSMLQQLTSQGVDVSCWGIGRSKGIAELWSEVQCGEAELRLDSSGRVCRCLSVVKVCVRRPEAPHEHLVEALQIFPDGRRRKRGMMLSETLYRHETPLDGAARGLLEELGTVASAARVDLASSSLRTWQEALESPSYPTLRSVYTLHQLDAVVRGLPAVAFATEEGGHADSSQDSMVHVWAWRRDADDGGGFGPCADVDKLETQLRLAIDAHTLERRNQVVQWHPSQPGVHIVGGPRQAAAWRDSALPNANFGKQARHPARMLPRNSAGRSRGFARSQRTY